MQLISLLTTIWN